MTTDEIARRVARQHAELDHGITHVYSINREVENGAVVTLLEVNEDAIPSDTIDPVAHGPSGEIPVPMAVIEMTPQEYEALRNGNLSLPHGWQLGTQLFRR